MFDLSLNLQTALVLGGVSIVITLGALKMLNPDAFTLSFLGVSFTFRKELRDAKEKLADAGMPDYDPGPVPQGLEGREKVRRALDELKAAVREALDALGDGSAALTTFAEGAEALSRAGFIGRTQFEGIKLLYAAGDSLMARSRSNIFNADAVSYWRSVQTVVYWLKSHVIPRIEQEKQGRKNQKPEAAVRRKTQVAGRDVFPRSTAKRPYATLLGVSGPLLGKHIPLESASYRIGADPGSDLVLADDEYVSARHAHIQHQNDKLLLYDDKSRNGTWLNDRRLSKTAVTLSVGDRVRVGKSEFRVEAPAD